VAATGEEAIRLTKQVAPDLILMDIHLRGKPNGIETIKRIRMELNRTIPAVFLTATRISKMEKIPDSIVLDKPFLEKELLSAVRRMVPGNHPPTDPSSKSSL
jgi:CheY-like chemotaxis protein